jgi:hypothetical protein
MRLTKRDNVIKQLSAAAANPAKLLAQGHDFLTEAISGTEKDTQGSKESGQECVMTRIYFTERHSFICL